MNRRQLFYWIILLLALCVSGVFAVFLCSRFEGFRHPLTMPVLLAGICASALALLLFLQ